MGDKENRCLNHDRKAFFMHCEEDEQTILLCHSCAELVQSQGFHLHHLPIPKNELRLALLQIQNTTKLLKTQLDQITQMKESFLLSYQQEVQILDKVVGKLMQRKKQRRFEVEGMVEKWCRGMEELKGKIYGLKKMQAEIGGVELKKEDDFVDMMNRHQSQITNCHLTLKSTCFISQHSYQQPLQLQQYISKLFQQQT